MAAKKTVSVKKSKIMTEADRLAYESAVKNTREAEHDVRSSREDFSMSKIELRNALKTLALKNKIENAFKKKFGRIRVPKG